MARKLSVVGIDIAKLVLHGVGRDATGAVVLRKRLARSAGRQCMATRPPRLIGMEAGGSAHDWARGFQAHGPDVRLSAPPVVKAYVKSPKNDARDAEAICAAVTRPTRRFVPIKRVEPQALQALHRGRERLVKARTALVNDIRGLLNESGLVLPQSLTKLRALIVATLKEEQATLTLVSTERFWHLEEELVALAKRVASYDEKLAAIGQAHPACQRFQTIPGIGPLSATALSRAMGNVPQCKNGRQVAAWLGFVPREHSTGGTPRLLGSSTRGNLYLRTLLGHGARAPLRWGETQTDDRSRWRRTLMARRGKNRAAVALANKTARIAWALLAHNQAYQGKAAA